MQRTTHPGMKILASLLLFKPLMASLLVFLGAVARGWLPAQFLLLSLLHCHPLLLFQSSNPLLLSVAQLVRPVMQS
jgi:hypothetical protein